MTAKDKIRKVKLSEVADINCRSIDENFKYEEIDYIDISSVGTGELFHVNKIKLNEAPSRAKRLVKDGDTILSTVRPNRRSFLYLKNPNPKTVVSTGFAVLTPKENINSWFLYYSIYNQKVTDFLTKSAKGAAYPAVDKEIVANVEILLPTIDTQNKIASILSAYDDLIENNTRRIKILEEMAQTIYKEWFINFRFPGYENVKLVDGLPEGWKNTKLGGIIELCYGKSLRQDKRNNGAIPVYGSGGIVGWHNQELVKGPGIVVGRKGNVGSVFWTDNDFFPIDTVYYVKTETSYYYVYYILMNMNFLSSDAAVPGLNREYAYSIDVLLPTNQIIKEFDEIIIPLFRNAKNLKIKNKLLSTTRNMLLQKLMN